MNAAEDEFLKPLVQARVLLSDLLRRVKWIAALLVLLFLMLFATILTSTYVILTVSTPQPSWIHLDQPMTGLDDHYSAPSSKRVK